MDRNEMKILKAEHEGRSLRIHDLVPDFTLEDVWVLPVHGGPDDFEELVDFFESFDPTQTDSRLAGFLWDFRDRLGSWLDLGEISTPADRQASDGLQIPGTSETSLRERLPLDLRDTAPEPSFDPLPFVPLYRTDREAAAEVSNRTVHGVAHLTWVEGANGRYEGWMAVYVKPRGAFGRAYMALIKPFRYRVVYPALMRQVELAWEARMRESVSPGAH